MKCRQTTEFSHTGVTLRMPTRRRLYWIIRDVSGK